MGTHYNASMLNSSHLAFADSPYIGSTCTNRSVHIRFHTNVCQQAGAYQWVSPQSFSDLSIPIIRCCVTLYICMSVLCFTYVIRSGLGNLFRGKTEVQYFN
jgi:hypothetical protein